MEHFIGISGTSRQPGSALGGAGDPRNHNGEQLASGSGPGA